MFNLLNVRSVAEPPAPSDVTARARIRDAAVRRFAADGFGAPVRAIAADAGVSPGLVIHHFGSKAALRAACDEHVLREVREAKTQTIVRGTPGDLLGPARAGGRVRAAGRLPGARAARRRRPGRGLPGPADRGRGGRTWPRGWPPAGSAPSRDPAARARFLVQAGIGALLVHLRRHPPVDGDFRATLRAYLDAIALPALELYTDGLLADRDLLDAYLAAGWAGPDPSPL